MGNNNNNNNNNDAAGLAFLICAPMIVIAMFGFIMLILSVGIVKCFMFSFSIAIMTCIIKINKNKTKGVIIGLIAFVCCLFISFALVVPNLEKESKENIQQSSSPGSLNHTLDKQMNKFFFGSKND